MYGKEGYEVTTYRIDGEYKDSRRPESVEFTSDLAMDLLRRDFTINAMAYNDRVGVVDKFDGIKDLEKKIIRCVGNPVERFSEDALRILRAVRFSAQLGFQIDIDTKDAIVKLAHTLANISAERIKTELDKTLMSKNPDKIMDAYKLGITKVILPEFDALVGVKQETRHHMYNVDKHTIISLQVMGVLLGMIRDSSIEVKLGEVASKILRVSDEGDYSISGELDARDLSDKDKLMLMWTMLLHDIAKPVCKYYTEHDDIKVAHFKKHEVEGVQMAKKVFNRLKFDNYTSNLALKLIRWHDYRFAEDVSIAEDVDMRRSMNKIGADIFEYLFLVKQADTLAQNVSTIDEKIADLECSYSVYRDIIKKNQCVSLKDLKLSGRDLIELGIKPGREIGEYLEQLLAMVIDNPELNDKESLIRRLNEIRFN